jgi:hypothetical protein
MTAMSPRAATGAPPSPRPWPSRPPRAGGHPLHMAGTAPQELVKGFATGDPPPSGLPPEEHPAYEQLRDFYAKHLAYAQIMSTRPQTLYGLADSPVDLAAFLLDHGDGTGPPPPPPRPRRPLRRLGTTPTPHPRTPNRLPTTPVVDTGGGASPCGPSPATQGSQPATGRRAALVVGASLSARAQGEGISPDGAGMPDPQQHDGAPSLLVMPTIPIENLAFACGHDVRVHRHDNLA